MNRAVRPSLKARTPDGKHPHLADRGAGVALVGRRKYRLDTIVTDIEQAGGTALAVPADLSDAGQAEAAVQRVVDRFGRLDILVNNAGLMPIGPVVGAVAEEWERMIAINVSSVAGRLASSGFGVYNLTKFGVNGFSESLRQEVTRRHVRVGVVEPGAVVTELGSHNTPEIRHDILEPFNDRTERLTPDDIADGVAYMVTRPRRTAVAELLILPTEQL